MSRYFCHQRGQQNKVWKWNFILILGLFRVKISFPDSNCFIRSYIPYGSYYKNFFIHQARANLRPLLLTKSSHICSKKWSRICRSSMLPIVKLYREFPDLPTPISSLQIVSDWPKSTKMEEIAQAISTRWNFLASYEYKKLLLIARVFDVFARTALAASRSLLIFDMQVPEVILVPGVLSDPFYTHPAWFYSLKRVFWEFEILVLLRPI